MSDDPSQSQPTNEPTRSLAPSWPDQPPVVEPPEPRRGAEGGDWQPGPLIGDQAAALTRRPVQDGEPVMAARSPSRPQTPDPAGATSTGWPQPSQATTALVLGVLSFFVAGVLGPFAWRMGDNEVKAIDDGLRDPAGRPKADAARILGLIATAMLVLAVLFVGLLVWVLISGAPS